MNPRDHIAFGPARRPGLDSARDPVQSKRVRARFCCAGRAFRSAGLAAVLAIACGTLAAAPSAQARRPLDPGTKGAIRLQELSRREARRLPSETNSPTLAPLACRWAQLDAEVMRFPTTRSNHTFRVAVHRVGRNPSAPVVILIHGILADHLTWKYVAAELAGDCELWLVDLPGCGESDAPAPGAIEPDGYSPTAMGDRVWQALQQCLESEGAGTPRKLTLVGHSLGGTVSIRMLSAPELRVRHAAMIRRVERVVLVAPCDLAVNAMPPSFRGLVGLSGFKVGAGEFLGLFDPAVRDLVSAGCQVPESATEERVASFAHVLADRRHRDAARAMLLQTVPFDLKKNRPLWRSIDPLIDDYATIVAPVLLVHGEWDETLYSGMGHKLRDEVPGAILIKVPERGHSLPIEDPHVCAELILRFQGIRTAAELGQGLRVKVYGSTNAGQAPGPSGVKNGLGMEAPLDSNGAVILPSSSASQAGGLGQRMAEDL